MAGKLSSCVARHMAVSSETDSSRLLQRMMRNKLPYHSDRNAAGASVQDRLQRNKRDVMLAVILTLIAGVALIASIAT